MSQCSFKGLQRIDRVRDADCVRPGSVSNHHGDEINKFLPGLVSICRRKHHQIGKSTLFAPAKEDHRRISAKRREWKLAGSSVAPESPDTELATSFDDKTDPPAELTRDTDTEGPRRRFSLARRSEALFSRGSLLNLPASVFAGITALGFLSYIAGIHNVTYDRPDGIVKQVGFLWAANWTFVFMVFLPLFLAFVSALVTSWKREERSKLVRDGSPNEGDHAWERIIDASSYSFWAVFSICVLFAGLVQWIGVCLIPLINGGGNYATDWTLIAVVRPEIVSVPVAIVFTGLAYLYMCICFYLFFAGLILLYTVVDDFSRIGQTLRNRQNVKFQRNLDDVGFEMMQWVFRCTVLGVLIATVMKLQSAYLTSNGTNILAWLIHDLSSFVYERADTSNSFSYRMPTHYSSLLIAMSTCFIFLYGAIRLCTGSRFRAPLLKMSAVVVLLLVSYLLVDAFSGFSILLGLGVLLAIYGLIDPGFGQGRASELGNDQSVS